MDPNPLTSPAAFCTWLAVVIVLLAFIAFMIRQVVTGKPKDKGEQSHDKIVSKTLPYHNGRAPSQPAPRKLPSQRPPFVEDRPLRQSSSKPPKKEK